MPLYAELPSPSGSAMTKTKHQKTHPTLALVLLRFGDRTAEMMNSETTTTVTTTMSRLLTTTTATTTTMTAMTSDVADENDSVLTDAQEMVLSLLYVISGLLSIMGSSTIIYKVLHKGNRRRKVIITTLKQQGRSTTTSTTKTSPLGKKKKHHTFDFSTCWWTLLTPYDRLMLGLSSFDIIASMNCILIPFLVPAGHERSRVWAIGTTDSCSVMGFIQQVSFGAVWYNCMLSFYYLFTIRFSMKRYQFARLVEPWMHFSTIVFNFTTAIIGISHGYFSEVDVGMTCWVNDFPKGCGLDETVDCQSVIIGYVFGAIPAMVALVCITCNNFVTYRYVRKILTRQKRHQKKKNKKSTNNPCLALGCGNVGGGRTNHHHHHGRAAAVVFHHDDIRNCCPTASGKNGNGGGGSSVMTMTTTPASSIVFMTEGNNNAKNMMTTATTETTTTTSGGYTAQQVINKKQQMKQNKTNKTNLITILQKEHQQQENYIQQIATQGSLYVISFLISYSPFMILRAIEGYTKDEIPQEPPIYFMLVLNSILLPLQGLLNMYIYNRPTYIKLRKACPNESIGWIIYKSCWEDPTKLNLYLQRNKRKREKSKMKRRKRRQQREELMMMMTNPDSQEDNPPIPPSTSKLDVVIEGSQEEADAEEDPMEDHDDLVDTDDDELNGNDDDDDEEDVEITEEDDDYYLEDESDEISCSEVIQKLSQYSIQIISQVENDDDELLKEDDPYQPNKNDRDYFDSYEEEEKEEEALVVANSNDDKAEGRGTMAPNKDRTRGNMMKSSITTPSPSFQLQNYRVDTPGDSDNHVESGCKTGTMITANDYNSSSMGRSSSLPSMLSASSSLPPNPSLLGVARMDAAHDDATKHVETAVLLASSKSLSSNAIGANRYDEDVVVVRRLPPTTTSYSSSNRNMDNVDSTATRVDGYGKDRTVRMPTIPTSPTAATIGGRSNTYERRLSPLQKITFTGDIEDCLTKTGTTSKETTTTTAQELVGATDRLPF